MAHVLILYSTVDGHTRKICERLQQVIEQHAHRVTLASIAEQPDIDLSNCDKVVIGASIRYGKHHERVYRFVRQHRTALEGKPSAFFTVNVTARKPDKCEPHTNPYLKKFLREVGWRPQSEAVFAGRIEYRLYRFRDRTMIRFIMWLTKGPTDPSTAVEFTDWGRVEAFGHALSAQP
jgi:menaquinone-dependent protoporphyrinogen oxidase